MIETNDYWIVDYKLIFKPGFKGKLSDYDDLISKYNTLIFSIYNDVNICIKTNNQYIPDYKEFSLFFKDFNEKINLPINITHLSFGIRFNQEVKLPENLTHLSFGNDFNKKVILPQKLIHLTFGSEFNQEVELPINITHLTFGNYFKQKVILPPNLTHLTLGWYFNQEVVLPPNITHLTFGNYFEKIVDIPLKVKYLKLNCNNLRIINYLPNSLEELELDFCFNLELNNLPSSIKIIKFYEDITKTYVYSYNKELNNLPNSIELIQLPKKYPYQIKNIPKQLKKIICSKNYKFIKDFEKYELETY